MVLTLRSETEKLYVKIWDVLGCSFIKASYLLDPWMDSVFFHK